MVCVCVEERERLVDRSVWKPLQRPRENLAGQCEITLVKRSNFGGVYLFCLFVEGGKCVVLS